MNTYKHIMNSHYSFHEVISPVRFYSDPFVKPSPLLYKQNEDLVVLFKLEKLTLLGWLLENASDFLAVWTDLSVGLSVFWSTLILNSVFVLYSFKNSCWQIPEIHSLRSFLEKPIHLFIHAIISSSNRVAAVQCTKSCRYRPGALANVQMNHQNGAKKVISVTLNVAWLFVPDRLIWVFL